MPLVGMFQTYATLCINMFAEFREGGRFVPFPLKMSLLVVLVAAIVVVRVIIISDISVSKIRVVLVSAIQLEFSFLTFMV